MLRVGARRSGAAAEVHFLDAPVDVLFERIRARNMEIPPITLEDLKRWAEAFERPSAEEIALFDPLTVDCPQADRPDGHDTTCRPARQRLTTSWCCARVAAAPSELADSDCSTSSPGNTSTSAVP